MRRRWACLLGFLFVFCSFAVYASTDGAQTQADAGELGHRMVQLVFQIGIILFAASIGAWLFEKLHMPSVLGEIFAGMLIGPYCLGSIPVPGFEHGFFPQVNNFPVSPELYGFATVASIVLLFFVGLRTDIPKLMKYSTAGSLVGIGGVVFSFAFGVLAIVLFSQFFLGHKFGFMHPATLFLGVISTATSVGITARILLDKKRIDSPEGTTILSGAVIDDVLGIIILAVVASIIKSGNTQWSHILKISATAIFIWLGFTACGLYFSNKISRLLKISKNPVTMMVLSVGMALLLAGTFEKSHLAMIIGAYVMGLSFSKTDIVFTIDDKLSALYRFLVPIFFCAMGMLVNFKYFLSGNILGIGLVFTLFAIFGKILGCAVPLVFLNFNLTGILRIGVGMVPRGEIALIVAGIGLASGVLTNETFSIAIIMTYLTTMITPFVFEKMLSVDKPVLRKELEIEDTDKELVFGIPNPQTQELVVNKVLLTLENEGFFVSLPDMDTTDRLYQIRKDNTSIMMLVTNDAVVFRSKESDQAFINLLYIEVVGELEDMVRNLRSLASREEIGRKLFADNENGDNKGATGVNLEGILSPVMVKYDLKSTNKPELFDELLELLFRSGQINEDQQQEIMGELLDRESKISTGMQHGIALPHAKVNSVKRLVCVIGLKKEGIDFDSLDGEPSTIFIMSLAPVGAAQSQLEFMAQVSKLLLQPENRKKVLKANSNKELYQAFVSQH